MKILLAIDGSKQSDLAIAGCANFLKNATHIKIVTVVEVNLNIALEPFAASAELYGDVIANERKLADDKLKDAEAKLHGLLAQNTPEISNAAIDGIPGKVIIEEAEKFGADIIVVGSHGYGFWERAMIGSVSDSVVHHAHCSVLVVK
jgi:nucleotide-binding universal stress UspA family protein